ncbi:MAG: DoxX family protein [Tannerella sp.]|jgi:putative oxidoreductase|nr:DoxX family protein [Tannerella sp.]
MIKKFLFSGTGYSVPVSLAILILRVVFGGMLMTHGWDKLTHFDATAQSFFAGMGGAPVLALVVFAEFFCALGVVVGLLSRLALIPMIINMAVAFTMAHGAKLVGEGNGELAFLYLFAFIALIITGPGKYAIDSFIAQKVK